MKVELQIKHFDGGVITMTLRIKSISLLLIVFISFSQIGCVDLANLQDFTDKSVKAGSKFKGIMNDSYRSCAVELYYQKARMSNFENMSPFGSPKEFLINNNNADGQECETTNRDAQNFIAANKVLMTYLYVMGQLADDGLTNTDDEFAALQGAVAEIPGGNNSFVGAASNLAKSITNIILESKRQKALKEVISQNNGNITSLTIGLSNSLDIYLTRLTNEKNRLKQMHERANQLHISFNRSLGSPQPGYDALLILNNRNALEAEIQNIDAKTGAAEAYKKVLSSIQKGHQELYVEANKGFNKKNAVKIALKYAPSIQTNYDEIIKVF